MYHYILVLNHDQKNKATTEAVFSRLGVWLREVTGGDILLKYKIVDCPQTVWGTDQYDITDAKQARIVNPDQIRDTAFALRGDFAADVACLVYDSTKIAPPPTNPAHSPVYSRGMTVMQMPSRDNVEFQLDVLVHELCHAFYYLVNTRAHMKLTDVTHSFGSLTDPRPGATYASVMAQLKPWYKYLGQGLIEAPGAPSAPTIDATPNHSAPIKGEYPKEWYVTQEYGLTTFALSPTGRKAYKNFPGGIHPGIDFGTRGEPLQVMSTVNGKVVRAGWDGGWGLHVEVLGGDGWNRQYAHLSKVNVHVGQIVKAGEVLGNVGNTGTSTGYHLHAGLRRKKLWRWEYKNPRSEFVS